MKRLLVSLYLVLCLATASWAGSIFDGGGFLATEVDGSPLTYVYKVIGPNGSMSITSGVLTLTLTGDVTADAVWDAAGDLIQGTGANTAAKLSAGTLGAYLRSGGPAAANIWSTLILPNAGTAYYLPVFIATNTMGQLATSGTTGQVLTAVTGAVPAWTSGFNGTVGAGTPAAGTFTTLSAGAGGMTVDADGDTVAKSLSITRTTTAQNVRLYEATGDGDNYFRIVAPNLTATNDFLWPTGSPAGQVISWATPVANVSTGTWVTPLTTSTTAIALTGNLTGLVPSVTVLVPSGTQDGGDNQAIMTDAGIDIGANALVGMTVYNITDGSSCTITANAATTITCTLAGGTQNDWDDGDVWQVGPGPAQSGSMFYVGAAGTIRHPATAGYAAIYYVNAAGAVIVDMASASMIFQGVLSGAFATLDAGDCIESPATKGSYFAIHNKSATEAIGLGYANTWIDGGAS